jgi:hypothetical protein
MGHPEDIDVYERTQIGIITAVHFEMDDKGVPTDVFSGFVAVRILNMGVAFAWVRWTNPLFSQSNVYGVFACPAEDDIVEITFDPRGYPISGRMMLFSQAVKPNLDLSDYTVTQDENGNKTKESDDLRLKIKKGEVMVIGKNGTSFHFRNDGTTILKLDSTKKDADTTTIGVDSGGNVFISGAQNVTVQSAATAKITCQNAELTANEKVTVTANDLEADISNSATIKADTATVQGSNVSVVSDNIELGGDGAKSAIIRSVDKCQHIDPILGIPVVSVKYVTQSLSTKAK